MPEGGPALQHRDVGELDDQPLVRDQPRRDADDLAAGAAQRVRRLPVYVQQTAGVAGGEEDPLPAVGGLAQAGRHPLQGVDRQLRVDGVLALPVRGVVVHPAALGHHGEDVLLVGPAVAELQTEPVVAVAVGELPVVGEVVVAWCGDVPRDTRTDEVVDEGGAAGYRHGPIVPSGVRGVPGVLINGQPGSGGRSGAADTAGSRRTAALPARAANPPHGPHAPRKSSGLFTPA